MQKEMHLKVTRSNCALIVTVICRKLEKKSNWMYVSKGGVVGLATCIEIFRYLQSIHIYKFVRFVHKFEQFSVHRR